MTIQKDGGPAFPVWRPEGPKMQDGYPEYPAAMIPGMTLRDYFAAQVVAGCVTQPGVLGNAKWTAERAYDMADAMLAARGAA